MKDSLKVVEYLKKNRGVVRLGIHGESLGGAIAVFAASN